MPVNTGSKKGGRHRFPPGFYAALLSEAEDQLAELVAAVDPRLHDAGYAPGLNAAQRAAVNKASKAPMIRSLEDRIASLRAGEPQLIPRGGLPPEVTAGIAWLGDREQACVLVKISADDTVEVGQTWTQKQRQWEIIASGFPVGRVDVETGEWIPRVVNPASGEWEDLDPEDY